MSRYFSPFTEIISVVLTLSVLLIPILVIILGISIFNGTAGNILLNTSSFVYNETFSNMTSLGFDDDIVNVVSSVFYIFGATIPILTMLLILTVFIGLFSSLSSGLTYSSYSSKEKDLIKIDKENEKIEEQQMNKDYNLRQIENKMDLLYSIDPTESRKDFADIFINSSEKTKEYGLNQPPSGLGFKEDKILDEKVITKELCKKSEELEMSNPGLNTRPPSGQSFISKPTTVVDNLDSHKQILQDNLQKMKANLKR